MLSPAPNRETDNVGFFQALAADPSIGNPSVILGDFNKVLSAIDRNPTRGEDRRVRLAIQSLTIEKGLVDGWRDTYPTTRAYSYWGNNDLSSASRIDRPVYYISISESYTKTHVYISFFSGLTSLLSVWIYIHFGCAQAIKKSIFQFNHLHPY